MEVGMDTGNHTRLDVLLPRAQKKLIEQAAVLLGQSISAFSVATLTREAEEVVERFRLLHLSNRDRDLFLNALDSPPKPNARLHKASSRHSKSVVQ